MFTYSHPYGPPGMSASSGKEKTVVSFSPELATSALMAQASFGQSNMLFPQYPQQAAAQLIRAQQWAAQWAMLFPQFSAAQHQQHNNSQQLPTPTANAAASFLPFPPQRPESSPTADSDDLTGSLDSPPSSKRPALDEDGCMRCPVPGCLIKFDSEGNLLDHVLHERTRLNSFCLSIKKKDVEEQIADQKDEDDSGSTDFSRTAKSRAESFQRVRLNQRRRIQGKAVAFQLNRDRATPSSDRQTNDERSPRAISVTPPVIKAEQDPSVAVAVGHLVCKGCETTREFLQANARCQHLRCIDCWQKILLDEKRVSVSCAKDEDMDALPRCDASEDKFGSTIGTAGCPVCAAPIEDLRDVCL